MEANEFGCDSNDQFDVQDQTKFIWKQLYLCVYVFVQI